MLYLSGGSHSSTLARQGHFCDIRVGRYLIVRERQCTASCSLVAVAARQHLSARAILQHLYSFAALPRVSPWATRDGGGIGFLTKGACHRGYIRRSKK